jgi:hypothetical protein
LVEKIVECQNISRQAVFLANWRMYESTFELKEEVIAIHIL